MRFGKHPGIGRLPGGTSAWTGFCYLLLAGCLGPSPFSTHFQHALSARTLQALWISGQTFILNDNKIIKDSGFTGCLWQDESVLNFRKNDSFSICMRLSHSFVPSTHLSHRLCNKQSLSLRVSACSCSERPVRDVEQHAVLGEVC